MHWRRDDINDPAETTCQWILKHESYQKWYKEQRGLLWIRGKPGAGKSTVLKYALEVAKQNNEGLILASFFFHGRGSLNQKSALGLFRSLLHQILQQVPDLLTTFASLYRQRCNTEGEYGQKWDWREKDLQVFFNSPVTKTAKKIPMRFYIDALDECGEDLAISLVGHFRRFADTIAICFACRHYPNISLEEAGMELSVEDENTRDIDAYITKQIQDFVQLEEKAIMIRRELKQRSNGNFQWVVLVTPRVIQFHKRGKSYGAICNLIRNVPSELADMYKELIVKVETEDLPQALHLMQWVCFAFRPLTLQELREATALDIHTSHASLKKSRTFGQYAETDEEMARRVLSLSQGLLEVEKHGSKRIVQFVHQSVMDFLLQDGFRIFYEQLPGDHLKGNVIARGHFLISRACIKYITMEDLEKVMSTKHYERFALIAYAFENWIAHAQIVEQQNVLQDDLVALLQPPSSGPRAQHEWQWNIKDLRVDNILPTRISLGATLIHIASAFRLSSVVSCILKRDTRNTEINARDVIGATPLHYAAEAGHEAIVRDLLGNRAEINAKDATGRTPMHYAVARGYKGVAYLLLEAGAAADPIDFPGSTPLNFAAEDGNRDIVELLLQWGAKADTVNKRGETPLSMAAIYGHQMTMELLREKGAQADTTNKEGRTPLSHAAEGGHESAVRLLLNWGAKADVVSEDGETSLSLAARYGHQMIVELLLEKGARANTRNKEGRTPLSYAAEKGYESVVRLLLEDGANTDSVEDKIAALAYRQGFYGILKLLDCAAQGNPLPPANPNHS